VSSDPALQLRDALAEAFVAAAGGERGARNALVALGRWARGAEAEPALARLLGAEGRPLFAPDGTLAEPCAPLAGWLRERARRYIAALLWMEDEADSSDLLEWARAAWDAGLFFEVHELLEPVWLEARGRPRAALQGVILAGAGVYHLTCENPAGASSLLHQAVECLRAAPPDFPLRTDRFAGDLERLVAAIEDGTVRVADDVTDVPRLERRADDERAEDPVAG
jgi:predicted metal-dependent hydrolase